MNAPSEHNPVTGLTTNYWAESRRPLASLMFIAPLLLTYEVGVLVFGVRNGADMWLRELLDLMGFSQHLLLPILTVGILLAWHHTTRQPWRLSGGVLCGMAVECVPLAFLLHLILQLQGGLLQNIAGSGCQCTGQIAVELSIAGTCRGLIQFLGAGIYEELLFRLILFSATAWALRRLGMASRASVVTAVLATSLLFSAAHYIGPYGDTLGLFSFLFRFLAGVYFCVLFVYRGFGIAAGTHAAYDILVGLLPY